MNLINKKTIIIYTIVIYLLSILVFEIGYCNSQGLTALLTGNGQEMIYNFSVCRIVMYLIGTIMILALKKYFLQDAITIAESKIKRTIIFLGIIATITMFIITICIISFRPTYSRGMSIGLLTFLLGSIFLVYVSNNIIKNAILTSLTFGMIFSISTTYNHFLDEKKHFMTAFNIAFGNFDYGKNPITDKQIEELPQVTKFSFIDDFLSNSYKPLISSEVNMEDVPSTPATYNPVLYLFSALGIFIAKTLTGSIIDIYIMGRIFNLLLYTILICFALKLLPYKKNIFFIVVLMPMALILAASYSIDGICIGCVSVFIAYCLKIKEENKTISLKNFICLIGMFFVLLLAKSMAYIMVALIFLMLPIIPTLKKNKKYLPIIISLTVISIILLLVLALYIKNTKITSDTRGGSNIDVTRQLDNIMHNPEFDLKLLISHMRSSLFNMDWYISIYTPVFFTQDATFLIIPMILFVLYVSITEDDYNFNTKEKILLISSFICVYVMTSAVLYLSFTEVEALYVKGYQSRYVIPILPLILMCLSNKRIKYNKSDNRVLNITTINAAFLAISVMQNILVK